MTQKKINDFTLASNITSNMQLETDIGGVTANKINISQLTSYFNANLFSPQRVIYVAKNGNDSTGTGSIDNPFLTIAAANAAISGASTNNRFLVFIYNGTYAETDLKAKAWTYYCGQGHSTRITSSTNLWQLDLTDTNWAGNARGAIRDLVLSGSTGISFDFSGLASASGVIDIFDITANGGLTLIGRSLGADTLQIYNSYFLGNVAITDTQGFIKDSFTNGSFTYTASTAAVTMDIQSFAFGDLNIIGTSGFNASVNIGASRVDGVLTVNGANATLNIDAISLPTLESDLSILNSATINKTTSSYSINYLSATASLNFGSVSANSTSDLTISLTGAAVGNTVVLGAPSVASGIIFSAFVSAADTVTVRAANVTSSPIVLSSDSFTVKII